MLYAEVQDVEAGFRALSRDEQTQCAALLSEAAVIIDSYNPDAGEDAKRVVSCRMVRRQLGESDSEGGVSFPVGSTQGTATALGYSQSWTMSGGSAGELYLSKLEKKLLGVGSRIGARSPLEDFGGTWQEIAQNRVLMGAGSGHAAGSTVEAGLPNITGSFVADVKKGEHKVSGAFTAGNVIASTGEYNSFSDVYKFSLDASKSNAIYGRSATVQPAAYYVHIWRRVA